VWRCGGVASVGARRLAELGVSRSCIRFREFEHGWEVRVRWWSCLNPGMLPKRGVPHARCALHPETRTCAGCANSVADSSCVVARVAWPCACARLRETVLRLRYEAHAVVRITSERSLDLTHAIVDTLDGASAIDADAMREHMPLVSPPATHILHLGTADKGAPRAAGGSGDGDGGSSGGGGGVTAGGTRCAADAGGGGAGGGEVDAHAASGAGVANGSDALPGAGTSAAKTMVPHALNAMCTALAVAGEMVAAAAADSGDVAVYAHGTAIWHQRHRGVEALAFHHVQPGESPTDGASALLTCGSDGCVRSWAASTGAVAGVLDLSGIDTTADRMPDGKAVVQCVTAGAGHAVAACGATVLTLHVPPPADSACSGAEDARAAARADDGAGSGEKGVDPRPAADLRASSRPPLPSAVADLCMAAGGGAGGAPGLSLVAGTLHSGVFVWSGVQLADPAGAASRWLECRSSVEILAIHPTLPWPIAASCRDRTVRMWGPPPAKACRAPPVYPGVAGSAPPLAAEASVCVPMTFGGLTAGPRGGAQTAAVALPRTPDVSDGASGEAADEALFLLADDAAGLLAWRLARASPKATHDDGMGVDSRRATRLALPDGRRALCVALRPRAAEMGAPPLLACGCATGVVVLITIDAAADAPLRAAAAAAHVLRVAPDAPTERPGDVTHLAWSADGSWLYAAAGSRIFSVSLP
jgi:hypothetical protein